ncbi:flagellar assembly factor FliW [Caldanaerovirga acetigignens]|uniref:Flagellar assembly factor FliW n=1 Tax=Caldanaerovirga acetigignens TaxID=447595 RepID=A0A1M7IC72_9FIRM|nr:flagellar assembly protein FliW [Caldanaerovirga acetigignens]SHM38416.1 flagellar assembly factor FliW [Caldanaerovirga acetigignens]
MKIKTKFFSEVEVEEEKIINFPNGIIGFEDLKRFVLIDHPGSDVIKWLQSVDEDGFALPVIDPVKFFPDYAPSLCESDLKKLKLNSIEDAVVLCVLSVPQEVERTTVNLKGPIVLNSLERLGAQLIAENPEYMIKHPVTIFQKKET